MAHPVRPDSYVEINNFYTVTVYNKGAEVVRMLAHLAGPDGFRQGTDLYFTRHDGQAVTTDDFVRALEDATGRDFSQFKRWYSQAGTPLVNVTQEYDAANSSYRLTLRQSCPPTPGQAEKLPFHIPIAVGLLDQDGRELPLRLRGEAAAVTGTRVLELTAREQVFEFVDVPRWPVPSLLRGFSAPVRLETDLRDEDYYFLMGHDGDEFNRWEAAQHLGVKVIIAQAYAQQQGKPLQVDEALVQALGKILHDKQLDKAFKAVLLTLPSETYLSEFMQPVDPVAIHAARQFAARTLAARFTPQLLELYNQNQQYGAFRTDSEAIGERALKNRCLAYLMELDDAQARALAHAQFQGSRTMSDEIAALGALVNSAGAEREAALSAFYAKWREEPLVVDKWLRLQAMSYRPDTLQRVQALTRHAAFNLKNPNKVRALIGGFCAGNPVGFHAADGAGYRFLAQHVAELDALNPQLAARMCTAFTQWRRYDAARQQLMRRELEGLLARPGLSRDVFEVVSKSLADTPAA
jgi:aminopeptidase N